MSRIPLAVPNIGTRERALVVEAMESGFVSSVGPFVSRFESEFAAAVGSRHAVACTSGTAAIHLGLQVLGVAPGDLVAVSDFTFIASANPVRYLGAEPLFVDSDRTSWNLDPQLLREGLEVRAAAGQPLPRVVEVVHALGQPADLAAIVEVCDAYGIAVLEDAAESLGASWSSGPLAGRSTGAVGRVGAFSFNGNKIATTGGGGMLVTDDPELEARARHLSTQAKVPDQGYLHDEVGYNYRLTNVASALGVAQLERLEEFVAAKRAIAGRYDAAFADTPLILPPRVPGADATYWLYSVLVPDGQRDALLHHLQAHDIDARTLWRPLHLQPPYADVERLGGAVGHDLFARGLSLPCSTDLDEAQQDRVIAAVRRFLED